MTRPEIDALRALCDGATAGPWRTSTYGGEKPLVVVDDALELIAVTGGPSIYSSGECEANAAFIAAARTVMPALLDALEAAESRVREMEGLLREWSLEIERASDNLIGRIENALAPSKETP